MITPRKTWLALLLVGWAALAPMAAHASSLDPRAEKKSKQPEVYDDSQRARGFYPQHEAFQSAAEHAVYIGYYQQQWGPFGLKNPERENNIIKSAAAIQDCLKKIDCNEEKQQIVLRALVQYNQGQELKAFMVKNSTNAEKMKTLGADDERGKPVNRALNKSLSELADHRFKVVSKGLDMNNVRTGDSRAPASKDVDPQSALGRGGLISRQSSGSSRATTFARNSGTARPDFFQLSDDEISAQRDEADKFGSNFVNQYRSFIDQYSATRPEHRRRYYRWVESQPNTYTLADGASVKPEDEARFQNAMVEQNSPEIVAAVKSYKDRIYKPVMKIGADGKPERPTEAEMRMLPLGAGQADIAASPEDVAALKAKGQTEDKDSILRFRASAHHVNRAFREAYEKSKKEAKKAGESPGAIARRVQVAMSPDRFDEFLDEIWPTSVKREKTLALNEAKAAAQEAADANASASQPNRSAPMDRSVASQGSGRDGGRYTNGYRHRDGDRHRGYRPDATTREATSVPSNPRGDNY